MRKRSMVLGMLAVFLISGIALAVPLPTNLAVDFRNWAGADGQSSFSYGGVTATANSSYKLSQGSFGLGVNSGRLDDFFGVNDEVDWGDNPKESLTVNFSGGKLINGFWLTNFHMNELGSLDEKGKALVNGSTSYLFTAMSSDGNYFLDFGQAINILSIVFQSDNVIGDYSVVGASAVPEPTTILLLGAGLIGLAGYGRRQLGK
jgi:hypothetical protein